MTSTEQQRGCGRPAISEKLLGSAQQQRVEEIAKGLNAAERTFLAKVCDGLKLGLADRKEDRARQKCRRLGLVHVLSKPRRWAALPLGIAVRTHLQEQAS